MFFTSDFRIGLSMLGKNINISNKGLLSILQDAAEMHSASIGFGVTDIDKTNYFEVLNSAGEIIAIATSKWVLIDVKVGRIAKIEDELIAKYLPEDKSVFNIVELDKLTEPETYTSTTDFVIRKSDIDVNNHVNNLFYVDMALEAFPGDSNEFNSCSEFEIYYKHQIRLDDKISLHYSKNSDENCIAIKSNNGEVLHSIIKFK